jgi:hypothetical protein
VTPASSREQMLTRSATQARICCRRCVRLDRGAIRAGRRGSRRSTEPRVRPVDDLQVCATYGDGFRALGTLMIDGFEAASRARRQGEAIVSRAQRGALARTR